MTSELFTPAWFISQPQRHAHVRLFCFAHAGGMPTVFVPWQVALGPTVEVCAIQLPGRGRRTREQPPMQFGPLVAELARAIECMSDMPSIFYGHSLGALLAFEVARSLNGDALPGRVVVAGCGAPQLHGQGPRRHELDDAALIQVLRDYDGTPAEILEHEELIQLLLPPLRADFALVSDYRFRSGRSLDTPLSVLVGRHDPDVPDDHVEAWAAVSSKPVTIQWFDGGHFFPVTHREAVLDHLRECISPAIPVSPA